MSGFIDAHFSIRLQAHYDFWYLFFNVRLNEPGDALDDFTIEHMKTIA